MNKTPAVVPILLLHGVYVFLTQEHLTIPGVIVVDNFGAGLTPTQIRERMLEYDQLTEQLNCGIVLLTTNRTVLDDMKGKEELLYIRRHSPGAWEAKWRPICEVHSADWLAHFALGDLYDRGEIL